MSKSYKLLFGLIIFSLILCSCSSAVSITNPETDATFIGSTQNITTSSDPKSEPLFADHFEEIKISFEDLVLMSDAFILGEFIETIYNNTFVEYKFKVKECYYGNIDTPYIYIYSNVGEVEVDKTDYHYEIGNEIYEKGSEYYLVLEKRSSIMYDHDRFLVSTDIIMNADKEQYHMYSEELRFPNTMSVKEYIMSIFNSHPHEKEEKTKPQYSNSKDEMYGESEYVGIVKINSLYNEKKTDNSNIYVCSVISLSKGEKYNAYEDGTILLSLMKGLVEVGSSYLIGFNPVDKDSLVYIQSTKEGVFPA